MKHKKNTSFVSRNFIFIIIGLIAVIAGLLLYKQYKPHKSTTVMKQVLVRRSKNTGLIQRGLTGKAIDINTGKIVKAARVFSVADKAVYLELDLQNARKGLVLDYLRYKNGRYVDHGEITLAKDNIQNILFNWSINNLFANLTTGKWTITTYTNGILAKRILYVVNNNQISYVYPEEPITPKDSDYYLGSTLPSTVKGQ